MASLFGLVLLFRLDTVVLMRGFETFDYGTFEFIMSSNLTILFNSSAYNYNGILIFLVYRS